MWKLLLVVSIDWRIESKRFAFFCTIMQILRESVWLWKNAVGTIFSGFVEFLHTVRDLVISMHHDFCFLQITANHLMLNASE